MKKFLFVIAVIIMAVTGLKAQTSLIATLSHEGNISAYYGSTALINAYEAAVDGDVITLSAGVFNATDIAKAITLRGSGMDADPATGRNATYINGDFHLTAPESSTDPIVIEGIFHNAYLYYGESVKAQFIKSRLYVINYNSGASNAQIMLLNCKVANYFQLNSECNATCINSIIAEANSSYITSIFDLKNCILIKNTTKYGVANNCIFTYREIGSSYLICNNCMSSGSNTFSNSPGANNIGLEDISSIFKSYDNKYNDEITYELTDAAKAQYIGNDGTEIGLYGGMMPFSTTPSTPQISKFNVAQKSTADGKLSIDITVSIPE